MAIQLLPGRLDRDYKTKGTVIPNLLQILPILFFPIFLGEPDQMCIALETSFGMLFLCKGLEMFSRAITTLGSPSVVLVLGISHD